MFQKKFETNKKKYGEYKAVAYAPSPLGKFCIPTLFSLPESNLAFPCAPESTLSPPASPLPSKLNITEKKGSSVCVR